MPVGVVRATLLAREPAGQQVRGRRLFGPQRVELVGEPAGPDAQPPAALAGLVARLQQDERRPGLPPLPALLAEEIPGGGSALGGPRRLLGSQRPARGGEQQLGQLGDVRPGPVVAPDRLVSHADRLAGQPGRHQHGAPVDRDLRDGGRQPGVPGVRLVEEAQRRRDVAALERHVGPAVHRHRRLELLTGGREEALGHRQVVVRPRRLAQRDVDQEAVAARASLPHRVAAAAQQGDGPAQIGQRRLVPAQNAQQDRAAHQHPPGEHPGAAGHRLVERLETRGGTTGQAEGHAEGGLDVDDPLRGPGTVRQAQRATQRGDRLAEAPGVAQYDRAGLMGDRGHMGLRAPSQQLRGVRVGVGRAGQGQRQQRLGVAPISPHTALRRAGPHTALRRAAKTHKNNRRNGSHY
jgi:hypothetical protein